MATELRASVTAGTGVVQVWFVIEDSSPFRVVGFAVVNTTGRAAYGTGWHGGEPIVDGVLPAGVNLSRNVPGNRRHPEDEVGVTLTWPWE